MTAVEEERRAVLLWRDRIVDRWADPLHGRSGQLEAARRPGIFAHHAVDLHARLDLQLPGALEVLHGDVRLRNDDLDRA